MGQVLKSPFSGPGPRKQTRPVSEPVSRGEAPRALQPPSGKRTEKAARPLGIESQQGRPRRQVTLAYSDSRRSRSVHPRLTCLVGRGTPKAPPLEPLRLRDMEERVKFRKPVFGAGAPKTNETCIRTSSPARGSQGAPAALRKALREDRALHSGLKAAGTGLAGRSRWRVSTRADRDLVSRDSHVSSGGGRRRRPR
jgi:hypothetical protein